MWRRWLERLTRSFFKRNTSRIEGNRICLRIDVLEDRTTPSASFLAAVNYPVGVSPNSPVVADFNADGAADIAVTNFLSNSVSVLMGNGNGTFAPAVSYGTGANPSSLAIGDFNGDGKFDLVSANSGNGGGTTFSILLGNGNGTFQTAVHYNSGGSIPVSVAVGDFNNDGKDDLAVTNQAGNTLSILLGNSNGTFQLPVSYVAGTNPSSVAVGDFNGDSILDLAVGNPNSQNVSILLGNGNGTFQSAVNYGVGSNPVTNAIAVGYFNADSILDLAVGNGGGHAVIVMLGVGDGTFQTPVSYNLGVGNGNSVRTGDFDGDGHKDLAAATGPGNAVSVLAGNGDGTFQTPLTFGVGSDAGMAVVGDFNGDGKPDLAVSNAGSNNVSVLLNNTISPIAPTVNVTGGTFDYDGAPHAATATATGVGSVSVSGSFTFTYNGSPTAPTNAGIYAVEVTFTSSDPNYTDATGSGSLTILAAASTTTNNGVPSGAVYSGIAQGIVGTTVTRVGDPNTVATTTVYYHTLGTTGTGDDVLLVGAPINSGMYRVVSTYAGDLNHAGSSDEDIFTIAKANATVVVTPYTVTYDGNPHSATVTSITGVNGETGAVVGSVTLNTTHTDIGIYANDSWSFTGTANYDDIASTTITNSIVAASPLAKIDLAVIQVNSLVVQNILNNGNGNALATKLNAATTSVNANNPKAAVNQLNAFINQVNAFKKAGKLSSSVAQSLIDYANEAISLTNM